MKVVVLDYLFPKGHETVSGNLIKSLSKNFKVKVITKKGYYDFKKIKLENIIIKECNVRIKGNNMISKKLQSLEIMLKTRKYIKSDNFKKIILGFDTVSFSFGSIFVNKKNMFIVHHKNIDELKTRPKKYFFNTYKNKVNHIVFEEFFRDYLVNELNIKNSLIYVVPHPIQNNEHISTNINNQFYLYDCIGLSNSNDDNFIKKLIMLEKEFEYLKHAKKRVILRSKVHVYDNGFLTIISGFLKKDKYDEYFLNCRLVFVPLPNDYIYRVSGSIFDAISNHKSVITSENLLADSYKNKYPNIITTVKNPSDFFDVVINHNIYIDVATENELFIKEHSIEKVEKVFLEIFEN